MPALPQRKKKLLPTRLGQYIDRSLTSQVAEKSVAECISDDALIHLKSYKYSSVDKSPISHYILRPYVCSMPRASAPPPPRGEPESASLLTDRFTIVECVRRTIATMAGAEHGDADWFLFYSREYWLACRVYARHGGAGMFAMQMLRPNLRPWRDSGY
jgi:hypothetical protein